MEQTFAKFLNINDINQENIKQEELNKLSGNVVEQNIIEGTAEFWDCEWHPQTKELNRMIKNGEKMDASTFFIFLDHNYETSSWCDKCRKTLYEMKQDEILKFEEGNTYKYKFFVCTDCAQIIKYATFYY
uniref:Uncharacterized protein n=1 Tax=Meloidogyne enterolobii TaxID=390850 RepID=A0A6V7X3S5_MELEN|nr:unnamed protein product [Meloidogyne enterolobii]CAD2199848.1 unnamed protein product [Meloidogyne enterolobii]